MTSLWMYATDCVWQKGGLTPMCISLLLLCNISVLCHINFLTVNTSQGSQSEMSLPEALNESVNILAQQALWAWDNRLQCTRSQTKSNLCTWYLPDSWMLRQFRSHSRHNFDVQVTSTCTYMLCECFTLQDIVIEFIGFSYTGLEQSPSECLTVIAPVLETCEQKL